MKLRSTLPVLLILLLLLAIARPASAQSSATIVKRLTDLETAMASLTTRVSTLEQENAAQAAKIADLETKLAAIGTTQAGQAASIAGLQSDLAQETAARIAGDNATGLAARQYADGVGVATLNSAKSYTDSKAADALAAAKSYADAKDATTLAAAKTYADSQSSSILSQAKTYTDGQVGPVADKLIHFSRNGNDVYITGANLYIRNGLGHTYANGFNGLGNLILGYNELRGTGDVRTGSHNLLLGVGMNYSHAGALMTGINNTSDNYFASVLGGTGNTSSGIYSVVVGGFNNAASGNWSTILGGRDKTAAAVLADLP